MTYLSLILGLIILTFGATSLVSGAVGIATRLGIAPMIIGLTLVGFGTSAPELSASLGAAFAGSPGIAVGNVVGSNIANILLILGLAAIVRPIPVDRTAFRRDARVLIGATLFLLLLGWMGAVGRLSGLLMVSAIVAYVFWTVKVERAMNAVRARDSVYAHEAQAAPPAPTTPAVAILAIILGFVGLIFGAQLLVKSAITIARDWGVAEAIIGLTVIAVGTSLPELATSLAAAWKGETDVAFGNVVGSNIFNALFILGTTALVHPLSYPASIALVDNWVMLAATFALLWFARSQMTISRREGAVLVLAYAAYVAFLTIQA